MGCASNPLPHRSRELRGLWVATVNNGDWPTRSDLTSDQQKQELIAILDRAASVHLNAIFLQVRPMADAFYPSSLEPWSQFLGATPDYDPLAFAV
ncbi:MAG TPA: family 10 glycosylhydrolase, partial [Thermoanaerobaculia bacterium]